MIEFYVLSQLILRVWLFGAIILFIVALADLLFGKTHSAKAFFARLGICLVWPLVIVSSQGRQRLLGRFKGV